MQYDIRPFDSRERWIEVRKRACQKLQPFKISGRNDELEQYLLAITLVGMMCSRHCPPAHKGAVRRLKIRDLKNENEWQSLLHLVIQKYYPSDHDDQNACADYCLDDFIVFIATMRGLAFSKYCPKDWKDLVFQQTIEGLLEDSEINGATWKIYRILKKRIQSPPG
jgi:hypothetical protein